MRISDVRTHVLLDPAYDVGATSSAQDTVVVEIETDEGLVGIGETDLNAWIARACIEAPGTHTMDRGLKTMLLGRDPLGRARTGRLTREVAAAVRVQRPFQDRGHQGRQFPGIADRPEHQPPQTRQHRAMPGCRAAWSGCQDPAPLPPSA